MCMQMAAPLHALWLARTAPFGLRLQRRRDAQHKINGGRHRRVAEHLCARVRLECGAALQRSRPCVRSLKMGLTHAAAAMNTHAGVQRCTAAAFGCSAR